MKIMTHLNPTHPLTQTLCLLLAIGCSSRVDVAKDNTGGAGTVGGGTSASGGAATTGGDSSVGGMMATGGYFTGTGGKEPTGGANTGGIGTSMGGTVGTGTECCAEIPACDPGDQQIDSMYSSTNEFQCRLGGSCYSRGPLCCSGVIYCMKMSGAGGAGSGGSPGTDGGATTTGGADTGGVNSGGSYNSGTGGGYSMPDACTPGQDQTCNDDPSVSSLMGQCNSDPDYCDPACCVCNSGYVVNPNTGKCNTYEQTVCYSPTQNIDKAYVDRAFGCTCNHVSSPPFCGIDSSGLRVYLECTSDNTWQSGSTNNCSGSDPTVCFSPTQHVENALAANGIGCSCDTATSITLCGDPDAGVLQPLSFTCTNGRWKAVAVGSCTVSL